MAVIQVFDGTKDTMYGNVLKCALAELANFQQVLVSPTPGKIDISGYRLVQEIQARAFNRSREQVDLEDFIEIADNSRIGSDKSTQKIIISEKSCYAGNLNWAFGQYRKYNGQGYIIVSMANVRNQIQLFDLFAHEIGHMYGAASRGRSNTYEELGSHCINNLCVMRQNTDVNAAVRYAKRRHELNADTYCRQCQAQLRR